jgi:hypothetical protein
MRYRLRRRGIVPFAFAVLLTVAAGLSLAEEHGWEQAEAPAAGAEGAVGSDMPGTAAHPAGSMSGRERKQVEGRPGVGSRALTGHDDVEPAADKQPN